MTASLIKLRSFDQSNSLMWAHSEQIMIRTTTNSFLLTISVSFTFSLLLGFPLPSSYLYLELTFKQVILCNDAHLRLCHQLTGARCGHKEFFVKYRVSSDGLLFNNCVGRSALIFIDNLSHSYQFNNDFVQRTSSFKTFAVDRY